MRLIDAGKLVNDLYALYEWCQDERKSGLEQAMCIVHEQPTAYDVDKVVEEINEESWEYMSDFRDSRVIDREDAIDIVKRGGIDG